MIYTLTLNPTLDREYTVPQLEIDEVLRASKTRVDCGGKGFNVSRMLAALGTPSIALGFIGGNSGLLLKTALEKTGINTDFVFVRGETRTNTSIVDECLAHHIKVNEAGPQTSASEISQLMDKISSLISEGDYWVLAGSLPPGAPVDIYASIINLVQAGGARAVLDCSGKALKLGCQAGPYLVKPNAKEAGLISGNPAETLEDFARFSHELVEMGIKISVISFGERGALLHDGKQFWLGHSPSVKEHNPVGAGDAMVAGMVWQMELNENPQTALRWGLACGAAAASQPGTGMPSMEIVSKLIESTKVEKTGSA